MAEVIGTAEYRLTADTSGLESGISKAKNLVASGTGDISSNAENATNKVSKFSTVATAAVATVTAKAVMAASSAIKNFAGGIVEVGQKFETTMSRVSALSGATGEDLDALSEKARQLGADTRYSASQVAEGFTYMAMAGWQTEDMLAGIDGLLNLATVGALDLGSASDIVTDQLTAFGLGAEEAGKMADIMAQTITNSNTDVSLMGETLKYVGSIAGSLGYSFDDVSVAIGLMANAGVKGSQAGTSLRAVMNRLANDTSGARSTLEGLGVSIINADGTMRDFGDAIVDMRSVFANLTDAEKAQLAATVAGTEGMSGFLAIMNASEEDFNKLTGAVNESAGAAQNMANIISDNVEGNIVTLQSRIESLQEKAFGGLKPSINAAISGLADFTDAIAAAFSGGDVNKFVQSFTNKLSTAIKTTLPQIGKAIGTIAPILIEALVSLVPSLVEGLISGLSELFIALADAIPNMVDVLIEAVLALIDILFSPEMIEMLLQAAIKFLMAIVDAIPTVITALTQALPTIINSILTVLLNPNTLKLLLDAAIQLFMALVTSIPTIITALGQALPQIINSIIAFLTDPNTILMLIDAAVQLFFALVLAVPQILGALLGAFGNLVGGLWEGIKQMFGNFASNFGTFITGIFKTAINGVLAFIENFINTPINLINGFIGFINGAFGALGLNIGYIGTVSLPRLYTGGIVEDRRGGTPIIAGDGGEDEFVVPESKMASLIQKIEEQGGFSTGETMNFTFNGIIGTPAELRETAVLFHDKYEEVRKARFLND